jgi:asparagine synthase (glutamine-hydrolysing)
VGQTPDRQTIDAMTMTLRHRGPDASGVYIDQNVALGHRRLSIIDVAQHSNQPLANEDATVHVVFNGEIYNFLELAAELRSRGHHFRTRSDTEVIVHGWEEWGPACVERLHGMFALAIYDSRQRELFLARDRLGKKPLHFVDGLRGFAFASEIKALRAFLPTSPSLDRQAIAEYAAYGYSLGQRTIYQGIRRLQPGHCLRLRLDEQPAAPRIERYWDVRPQIDPSRSEADWLEELDSRLSQAVRRRMISDVPLGAFLSGGIDSSLVVAYMAKHSTAPVKTFTIGFHEQSHDESATAAQIAQHLGVEHHVQIVEPNGVEVLDRLVHTYDEPFGDESAIPTYYLCEFARQHVTVALSGDGGDESFLGYRRYGWSHWMNRFSRAATPLGRHLARQISGRLSYAAKLRRPLQRLGHTGFDLYHHAMGYSDESLCLLHRDMLCGLYDAAESPMAGDYSKWPGSCNLDRYAYTDLMNYLPDDILVKVDRASMSHSLEVRCPLLDHEMVELGMRIPARHKMRGLTGKRLLRKLLRRHLPATLTDKPKRGFSVPLASWFRGPLKPLLDEMLADRGSVMWDYFHRQTLQKHITAHAQGRANLQSGLWRALFFYRWSQQQLPPTNKTDDQHYAIAASL